MDESTKNSPCKECDEGADSLHLHAEVEHLRQHLAERDSHIVAIEGEYLKSTVRANDLEEQLNTWREKYERLYDSHKRVQKLNQVLEDKLLQMVDKMKGEKSQLTKDIATLSVRLAESKHNYSMLQKENERYKNDMNLAIQLLQCKPDNFVSQKLDNLPVDTQARVSQYVMSKMSKPPSSTQSKNGNEIDTFDASEYEFNISASLMTKILEDSIQDTMTKHCDTCTCNKSQNKPFCYNDSCYSVSTQTFLSGEQKNSLCLNCNAEIKSAHSNLSIRSHSPQVIKLITDKISMHSLISPMYIIPQQTDHQKEIQLSINDKTKINCINIDSSKNEEEDSFGLNVPKDAVSKIEIIKSHRNNNEVNMEPAIHHKLCDRTKTSISSKKSSIHDTGNDDLLMPQSNIKIKETKSINENKSVDLTSLRKNSQSSMGAMSRTSSIAKSTVSTHKSNTQVGPGPRFCHLRMQAGSKNILLDNAEPDVPPVLYTRQSKCNENSLFKDLNDDIDNFINLDKSDLNIKEDLKNDNVVIESTLIDVHIDNNNKESGTDDKDAAINPVLLNVSSSPLQPLKTHNFSNSSEHNNNNNKSQSSQQNISEIDNLLKDFNVDLTQNNRSDINEITKKQNVLTLDNNHDVKIFNFDHYEQNRISSGQYNKPLKKIDMSHLHSIENTKISKDLPPLGEAPKLEKKTDGAKPTLTPVVNVYPNLTQTHLKVNEHKKVFTNDHSVSSLSSDDSAALLQKQQLLRVAEWVEKNLELQNNFNDPLEDDSNFNNKTNRRDNKLSRLTETLNELALNMPHPVSKYSKSYNREGHSSWLLNNSIPTHEKTVKHNDSKAKISCNVVKETIFPVESGGATTEICKDNSKNRSNAGEYDVNKEFLSTLKTKNEKEITREDLARMEYNVKKFLLSGHHWVNPASVGRSRRTSSKTETDV